MLVLTRKRSEMIRIGEDIVVKVIRTGKGTVKLGVEAPAHVRVLRGELCFEERPGHVAPVESDDCDGPMAFACSDQFPHVA